MTYSFPPDPRHYLTDIFGACVILFIAGPLLLGVVSLFIQLLIYVFTWEWPYLTILTILKSNWINSTWALSPNDFFGLHKVLDFLDMWMFAPIGIVWAILMAATCMPWVNETAYSIERYFKK